VPWRRRLASRRLPQSRWLPVRRVRNGWSGHLRSPLLQSGFLSPLSTPLQTVRTGARSRYRRPNSETFRTTQRRLLKRLPACFHLVLPISPTIRLERPRARRCRRRRGRRLNKRKAARSREAEGVTGLAFAERARLGRGASLYLAARSRPDKQISRIHRPPNTTFLTT
jgi:hypothetical protein